MRWRRKRVSRVTQESPRYPTKTPHREPRTWSRNQTQEICPEERPGTLHAEQSTPRPVTHWQCLEHGGERQYSRDFQGEITKNDTGLASNTSSWNFEDKVMSNMVIFIPKVSIKGVTGILEVIFQQSKREHEEKEGEKMGSERQGQKRMRARQWPRSSQLSRTQPVCRGTRTPWLNYPACSRPKNWGGLWDTERTIQLQGRKKGNDKF